MSDSEMVTMALKIAYAAGFVLHILSIALRIYLILYGPIQFVSLIPYMLLEVIFLVKSMKVIFVSSTKGRIAWAKTFALINSLLFLLLFIVSIFYSRLLERYCRERCESPTWNIIKVICIIFLSGPLVTNSAFLGITYLSISRNTKEVPNLPCLVQLKDLYTSKVYSSGIFSGSGSTDTPTQYSLQYNK